jgi:hypothetical protein
VIGAGQDAAMSRLFTLETDPGDELGKALYDAYDAKESCAELLPEVGHEWDAIVLTQAGQAIRVPSEICALIEALYRGHAVSPFDKPSTRPKSWQNRLRAFASDALGRNHQPALITVQGASRGAQRDW